MCRLEAAGRYQDAGHAGPLVFVDELIHRYLANINARQGVLDAIEVAGEGEPRGIANQPIWWESWR